jgi:hypothetical protein
MQESAMTTDRPSRLKPWKKQGLSYFEWCVKQEEEKHIRHAPKIDSYLPRPPVGALLYVETTGTEPYRDLRRYFVERLPGGCLVYWLGKGPPSNAQPIMRPVDLWPAG